MAVTFIALLVFLLPVCIRFAVAFVRSWRAIGMPGRLLVMREYRMLFEPVRVAGNHEHTTRLQYRWEQPCLLKNLALPEACCDFLVLELAVYLPNGEPRRCVFAKPLPALCFQPEYFSGLAHLPQLRALFDGLELRKGSEVTLKVRNRSNMANDLCARLVAEMAVPCPEPARVLS